MENFYFIFGNHNVSSLYIVSTTKKMTTKITNLKEKSKNMGKNDRSDLSTILMIIIIVVVIIIIVAALKRSGRRGRRKGGRNRGRYFDYIIIGGGAAGCTMANMLSKDPGYDVLVLEAGDDNSDDPRIFETGDPSVQLDRDLPDFFWQGTSIQQIHRQNTTGDSDIKDLWTSGRLLGGGTSINGYQVVRGSQAYYHELEEKMGPIWSIDEVNRRYKEIEDFTAYGFTPSETRGEGGPWSIVTRPKYITQDETFFAEMVRDDYGVPIVSDYNDPNVSKHCAFTRWQLNQQPNNNFNRESADTAFLTDDILARENLTISINSTVLRFIWEEKRVSGVRYVKDGVEHIVYARMEVILSAGFRSAQILQVNGIGPRSVLEKAGVEVKVENDHVGRHLINHPLMQMPFLDFTGATKGLRDPNEPPGSLYSAGAFVPDPTRTDENVRGIEWIFLSFTTGPSEEDPTFVIAVPLIMNPISEGTIEIQNGDPLKQPLVDTNYYNDPEENSSTTSMHSVDLMTMRRAAKDMVASLTGRGFVPIGGLGEAVSDGSDEAYNSFILADRGQAHHWQNQVRMGKSATDGVVDAKGKVYGVQGLIVADGSILPPVDGNLGTPSVLTGYTIAEELIKER